MAVGTVFITAAAGIYAVTAQQMRRRQILLMKLRRT